MSTYPRANTQRILQGSVAPLARVVLRDQDGNLAAGVGTVTASVYTVAGVLSGAANRPTVAGVGPGAYTAALTTAEVGELTWRTGGQEHAIFVSGGFVEVKQDTVRVVSEAGERPKDIDVERAREAEKRARERLEQGGDLPVSIDILRAELSLRRAQVRLKMASQLRL